MSARKNNSAGQPSKRPCKGSHNPSQGVPRLPPDNAARERAANDLDTTLLVEAAAGTGKTTLLIRRVLSILRSGRATLPQIAAITFTEKAAGELKVRLRREIEEALRTAQKSGDPSEPLLRAALEDLQGMTVCTIHKFCGDLIRERPVEARVEPGFAVADELTASLVLGEAWERWLAQQMSGENPPLRRAMEAGFDIEQHLRTLAQLLVDNRDVLNPPSFTPGWSDAHMREKVARARTIVASLRDAMSGCAAPGEDKGALQIAALAEWADGLDGDDFDRWSLWLERAPKCNPAAGNQGAWRKGSLKGVKSQFVALRSLMSTLAGEATHRILCELTAALAPFLAEHAAAKEAAGLLDFMDLLLKARDMLRDDAGAREYFKRAYRFILVDEFQDTDPLQAEIVFFLSERAGECAAEWRAVRLEPGKLFIVGDPKQSIYRFRRADLDLYGQVKKAIAAQGETLQLSANFRTVPAILGEVNALFAPLMTGPVAERYEPEHVELKPHRTDGPTHPVLLLCPPATLNVSEFNAAQWRQAEAGCIAAAIREFVESGHPLPDGKGGARPARYGDVAVLYRTTTGLEELEQALRAHGVPYAVTGGRHYFTRQEFQDLLTTLRAIDDPYDAISVVGALRSPFFGHSDEDLLAHVIAGGRFDYRVEPPPDDVGLRQCLAPASLGPAFATLRRLHELRRSAAPVQVLAELFEATEAAAIYALKPYGAQRVANLLKVQEMARALAQARRGTFGGLVEWLRTRAEAEAAEDEGLFQEEGEEEFVRLTTFHKAKGLEFPVVFLANLGYKEMSKETALVERVGGRLHLNLGSEAKTLGWAEALEAEKERQSHEEDRLLYVAMTRARDRLFLPLFWWAQRDAGFLGRLRSRYEVAEGGAAAQTAGAEPAETERLQLDRPYSDEPAHRPKPQEPLPPAAREALAERRAWQESLDARVARLNLRPGTLSASGLMGQLRTPPEDEAASIRRKDFGSLVHRLLELVNLNGMAGVARLASLEAARLGLGEAEAAEAAQLAARAWESPVLRRARASGGAQPEAPFTAQTAQGMLEGCVDLVFIENDEAVIVDYKTNRIEADAARAEAEKYRPQAQVYASAMAAALGVPVKEVVFLFVRPGVEASLKGAELLR